MRLIGRPTLSAAAAGAAMRPARPRRAARMGRRWSGLRLRLIGAALGAGAIVAGAAMIWNQGVIQKAVDDGRAAWLGFTQEHGFVVREVLVTGRVNTDPEVLRHVLAINRGDPILTFTPEAVRALLLEISWIADAEVSRQLPDTLVIHLTEREPFARWQVAGHERLIDRSGAVLTERAEARFGALPLIVGPGADTHVEEAVQLMTAVPGLAAQIRGVALVGERRWDVTLKNGVLIRLPEDGPGRALSEAERLLAAAPPERVAVSLVDLRLPDRVVVRSIPFNELGEPNRLAAGRRG